MPEKPSRRVSRDRLLILSSVLLASGMVFFQAWAQTSTFALPPVCVEKGISDPEECKRYMDSLPMTFGTTETTDTDFQPTQQCVEKGISDPEECKRYMDSLPMTFGTTETTDTAFQPTQQCVEKGIEDPEECKRYMDSLGTQPPPPGSFSYPPECIEKGITDPEACKKYLESLREGTLAPPSSAGTTSLTPRCVEAGITDMEECRKLIDSLQTQVLDPNPTMTPPCIEKGIKDAEECKRYMISIQGTQGITAAAFQVPQPCVEKGIKDPMECRKLLESLNAMRPADGAGQAGAADDYSRSYLPPLCVEQKIADPEECEKYMNGQFGDQDESGENAAYFLPKECMDQKISDPKDCQKMFEARSILPECKKAGANTPDQCKSLMVKKFMPKQCLDEGITDEKECKSLMSDTFMPPTCKAAGLTDMFGCKELLLKTYGKPKGCEDVDEAECWRRIDAGQVKDDALEARMKEKELPQKCKDAGADDFDDCQEKLGAQVVPEECRQAGVFSPEGCKKHLFEKYEVAESMRSSVPEECRTANADDPESCKKLMQSMFFPKACLEQNISDPEECKKYMTLKSVPAECRDAGIEGRDECEKLLREKHMMPACQSQGITDEGACKEFMYSRMAKDVKCEGLGSEQCALTIKERHLGRLLDAGKSREEIDNVLGMAGDEDGMIDPASLQERGDDTFAKFGEIAPFDVRGVRKLRLLDSDAGFALDADDEVRSAGGKLLAYDNDGDGLPDEMERRHGTDPDDADTDGDGVNDKDELKKGKLGGVDKAFADGIPLGQPTIEGEVDEAYTVALSGLVSDQANQDKTGLEGTGIAGDVIALYIYSDLPIVVTTTVDANGQWSYQMDDQLKDGLHEVYVAVNDDTGKVVKKSDPLSFLVSGAQAASVGDAVAAAAAQAETERVALDPTANVAVGSSVTQDLRTYMIAGGALIGASILALTLVLRRKKPSAKTRP